MSKALQKKLSRDEKSLLRDHESVLHKGMEFFIAVGIALAEIRDRKLYRETYGTFEDYCRDRWGMSRNYGDRLIRSAHHASEIGVCVRPDGTFEDRDSFDDSTIRVRPTNERQVRPLFKLPKAHRQPAWKEAVSRAGMKVPTAEIVKEVAAEMVPMGTKTDRLNSEKTGTIVPKRTGETMRTDSKIRQAIDLLKPFSKENQMISDAIALLSKVIDDAALSNPQQTRKVSHENHE